jgi:methyl-accepting chemotaxis protein
MSGMSLRKLLLSVVITLVAFATIQGVSGLVGSRVMTSHSREIAQNWIPSIRTLAEIKFQITRYRLRQARAILTTDTASASKIEQDISVLLADLKNNMNTYDKLVSSSEERAIWTNFNASFAEYSTISRSIADALQSGQRDKAAGLFNSQALETFDRALADLNRGVALNARGADDEISEGATAAVWSNAVNGAFLVGALLIGFLANRIVTSRVAVPMHGITTAMTALAKGDLRTNVPYADRRDEIGDMAAAMQIFKNRSLEAEEMRGKAAASQEAARKAAMAAINSAVGAVVSRAAEGDFSARLDVETADPEMRDLMAGINRINTVVDEATHDFAQTLSGVAEGDLTLEVKNAYRGRLEELKQAINTTVTRLSETVTVIQSTAHEVASAAVEIRSGSTDLARRTEQQASSLEETAGTTEELAASVKASAQSSRDAVRDAEQARSVAQEGGSIVGDAILAMNRIEQASAKIGDITTVIEEIAFQTNLLALNAAVEAARAGEAGKGFAVVAAEVRTLAQRSSDAAKDIGGLISTSKTEVAQGVSLVKSAGDTLERIVEASVRVASTVGEIATSAAEQANGIEEMSHAVAQLDEMTQQNAALSEQSSASATALGEQIDRLSEMLGQFRTGTRRNGGASQAAGHLRKIAEHAFTPGQGRGRA